MQVNDKINGLIFGTALGDSWGYVTEFWKINKIMRKQPAPPHKLVISDDTQMSIYNFHAMQDIMEQGYNYSLLSHDTTMQNNIRKTFAEYHLDFAYDKRNNRAPGMACMKSLKKYNHKRNKVTGREGSIGNNSKGCGTIMRSPWLGVFPIPRETIVLLSIIQSQTTHDHPTAWIASAISSVIVHDVFHNINTSLTYTEKALLILDEIAKIDSNLVDDSALGIVEIRQGLNNINKEYPVNDKIDPNVYFGSGWTGDTALYNAVGVCDMDYANNPFNAVKRLVYTNGDSDSIAAIGGAFTGVENGYNAFNYDIINNLEDYYAAELKYIVKELTNMN